MSKARIFAFLKREVPYTKERMEPWRKAARALGDEAPEIFIETLKTGPAIQHDAALLALREFGYEAWAHGFWAKTTYSVAKPGTPALRIVPVHTGYPNDEKKPKPTKPRKIMRKSAPARKSVRAVAHKA